MPPGGARRDAREPGAGGETPRPPRPRGPPRTQGGGGPAPPRPGPRGGGGGCGREAGGGGRPRRGWAGAGWEAARPTAPPRPAENPAGAALLAYRVVAGSLGCAGWPGCA